jgi:hypothetical protein
MGRDWNGGKQGYERKGPADRHGSSSFYPSDSYPSDSPHFGDSPAIIRPAILTGF